MRQQPKNRKASMGGEDVSGKSFATEIAGAQTTDRSAMSFMRNAAATTMPATPLIGGDRASHFKTSFRHASQMA
jgi:hypothetical protein